MIEQELDLNIDKALKKIRQLKSEMDSLGDPVSVGAGGGSSSRRRKPPRHYKNPQSVIDSYRQAVLDGDPGAADHVLRAQAQLRRQGRAQGLYNTPSFSSRLGTMLSRTRVGGKFAPLLGDVAKLLGAGAGAGSAGATGAAAASASAAAVRGLTMVASTALKAAGPIGLVVSAALMLAEGLETLQEKVKKVVAALAEAFMKHIADVGSAYIYGGGPPGIAGASARASRVLFGDPTGGARFMEGLKGNPLAMSAAMQMGVNPISGPFGNMNYNRDFIKILKEFAGMEFEPARRKAAMFGSPELAGITLLNKEQKEWILQQSADTKESVSLNMQYRVAQEMVREQFMTLAVQAAPTLISVLKLVTSTVKTLEPIVKATATVFSALLEPIRMVVEAFSRAVMAIRAAVAWIAEQIANASRQAANGARSTGRTVATTLAGPAGPLVGPIYDSVFGANQAKAEVVKENTRALRENTNEIKRFTDGVMGGGRRTRRVAEMTFGNGINPDFLNNLNKMRFGQI